MEGVDEAGEGGGDCAGGEVNQGMWMGGRETYRRPVVKIPATPSFFLMLMWRSQMPLMGRTRMLASLRRLMTLVDIIITPVSRHFPGSMGFQAFSLGLHEKVNAKKMIV